VKRRATQSLLPVLHVAHSIDVSYAIRMQSTEQSLGIKGSASVQQERKTAFQVLSTTSRPPSMSSLSYCTKVLAFLYMLAKWALVPWPNAVCMLPLP
jgi:hypothetical protein